MVRLWLRLKAPFAAFRPLQAGSYRSTAVAPTPSAVWGIVLNLAGVDSRGDRGGSVTQLRADVPPLRLAIGLVSFPGTATLYQQLHNYPVGNTAQDLAPLAKGAKYAISPVRRELLVGLDSVVGVESLDEGLLTRVARGLQGELGEPRYGLPFAGDNNLLFDRIDILGSPPPVFWLEALDEHARTRPRAGRLTTRINRHDSAGTMAPLYAPTAAASDTPPEAAWTWVPAPPASPS